MALLIPKSHSADLQRPLLPAVAPAQTSHRAGWAAGASAGAPSARQQNSFASAHESLGIYSSSLRVGANVPRAYHQQDTGLDVPSPQRQIPPVTSDDASFLQKKLARPNPLPFSSSLCGPSPRVPVPFVLQPRFSFPQRAILQHHPKALQCTHHRHGPPDSRERPVDAWKPVKAI